MSIIWTIRHKHSGWYRTAIKLSPLTRIHIFWRGDYDRAHHDHPNNFWTFPFRAYWEEVTDTSTGLIRLNKVKSWRWHFRPAEYRHRVLGSNRRGGFITLVRERPAHRSWGFYPGGKFVHWKDYVGMKRADG